MCVCVFILQVTSFLKTYNLLLAKRLFSCAFMHPEAVSTVCWSGSGWLTGCLWQIPESHTYTHTLTLSLTHTNTRTSHLFQRPQRQAVIWTLPEKLPGAGRRWPAAFLSVLSCALVINGGCGRSSQPQAQCSSSWGLSFQVTLNGGSSESSWYWKCPAPAGRRGPRLLWGPLQIAMRVMLGVDSQDGSGAVVRVITGLVWHLPRSPELVWELISFIQKWGGEQDISRPGLRLDSATSSSSYHGKPLKCSILGFLLDQDCLAHIFRAPYPPVSTADSTHCSHTLSEPRCSLMVLPTRPSCTSFNELELAFQMIPFCFMRLAVGSDFESLKGIYKIQMSEPYLYGFWFNWSGTIPRH